MPINYKRWDEFVDSSDDDDDRPKTTFKALAPQPTTESPMLPNDSSESQTIAQPASTASRGFPSSPSEPTGVAAAAEDARPSMSHLLAGGAPSVAVRTHLPQHRASGVARPSASASELLGSMLVNQHNQQQELQAKAASGAAARASNAELATLATPGSQKAANGGAAPQVQSKAAATPVALPNTCVWTAGQVRRVTPLQARANYALERVDWRGPKQWRPKLSSTQLEALRMMAGQ
jgi:hypothetical protein